MDELNIWDLSIAKAHTWVVSGKSLRILKDITKHMMTGHELERYIEHNVRVLKALR